TNATTITTVTRPLAPRAMESLPRTMIRDDVHQDLFQIHLRRESGQLRQLLNGRDASSHIFEVSREDLIIRNTLDLRRAPRLLLDALRELENRDFLDAADIDDLADGLRPVKQPLHRGDGIPHVGKRP